MSVTFAARAFAQMYSVQMAQEYGFLIEEHHMLESVPEVSSSLSTVEQWAKDFGDSLAKFNKGTMKMQQQTPSDTDTPCYEKTAACNAELLKTLEF